MWELDHKEGFSTVVLEKILESPLDCKEIQPVNPKGYQPWILTGRTDANAIAPICGPPDPKSWLIAKDPDAWKGWGQKDKGATKDDMVGLYHRLNGYEFEQIQGDSERQESLACHSSWGRKESDTTEQLSNKEQALEHTVQLYFGGISMCYIC